MQAHDQSAHSPHHEQSTEELARLMNMLQCHHIAQPGIVCPTTQAALALLDQGADPNGQTGADISFLTIAVQNCNPILLKALLIRGAGADPNQINATSKTPITTNQINVNSKTHILNYALSITLKYHNAMTLANSYRQSQSSVSGNAKQIDFGPAENYKTAQQMLELLLSHGASNESAFSFFVRAACSSNENHPLIPPVIERLLAAGVNPWPSIKELSSNPNPVIQEWGEWLRPLATANDKANIIHSAGLIRHFPDRSKPKM